MLAATTPPQITSVTTNSLLVVFAEFLDIDVSAGDAAADTLKTYSRQLQQFLSWCDRQELNPAILTKDDIKTIALKLAVVRRFYQAAVDKGLLPFNPASGVKPPKEKCDPAEKITYLEKAEVETEETEDYQTIDSKPG